MTALSIIIDIVLILISIVLIVTVLMQEGQRQGLGAIGGGAETFFGKNKAKSMEGRLQKYTKIAAVAFIVLAIAATIINAHNTPAPVSVNDAIVEEAADAAEQAEAAVEEAEAAAEDKTEEAADAAADTTEKAADTVEEAAADAADTVEKATRIRLKRLPTQRQQRPLTPPPKTPPRPTEACRMETITGQDAFA